MYNLAFSSLINHNSTKGYLYVSIKTFSHNFKLIQATRFFSWATKSCQLVAQWATREFGLTSTPAL